VLNAIYTASKHERGEYEHQYKTQQVHPAVVLCPICIPEKQDINQN
jgi:hypothetical protein